MPTAGDQKMHGKEHADTPSKGTLKGEFEETEALSIFESSEQPTVLNRMGWSWKIMKLQLVLIQFHGAGLPQPNRKKHILWN